ncbi:MAG: GspB domain-containing protein [Gammaproteobacteria bacterium]|nr:GspB domain-containing protein [Gammaproteobacteria bacterium]
MSYILDALKKNQAEQLGEGVTLRTTTRQESRTTPQWLVWFLVAVLVVNAGLLVWSQLASPTSPQQISPQPAPIQQVPIQQAPIQPAPRQQIPTQQPLNQNTEPAHVVKTVLQPKLLALADLPSNQQSIYLGLNFTSHLYTDIPSECVIRVDGISLRAGDPFKGLKVVKITESGVIFEEQRNGIPRHIEVPVLEQLLN